MRTFLALAWRRSADEKIPLSSENVITNNGAIPKPDVTKEKEGTEKEKMASDKLEDSKLCSHEKNVNDKAEDLSTSESKPMSLLRKFAMFVSLDIIVLYFLAFAWLIPCRLLQCNVGKEWTVNLDNISISTNLEVGGPLKSPLLLFGHYEENLEDSEGVTALQRWTGAVKWQIPMDFRPARCHCDVVDVNEDGVPDCLIFGEAHLLALNASDGHVFWSQDFRRIALLIATVGDCDNERDKWIILVKSKDPRREYVEERNLKERISMVILDSKNGSVVRDLPLPCDYFPKQLVTWKSKTNVTYVAFQCTYNGRTEVNLISEEELCNQILGKSASKRSDFSVLFSFGSSTAVDDVFLLPVSHVGLVVGWSTMVVIATDARDPPRLLWQTMSGSIRSAIKFLTGGHLTSRDSMQIAVVMYDDSSSVVKFINVSDGEQVASLDLGLGTVTSVVPVPRKIENVDSLLIVKESESSSGASRNRSVADDIDFTTESTQTADMTYLLLTIEKETNVTELLTENRRTEITVIDANCTTVFIATLMSNRTTRISSRDINRSKMACSCS